MCSDSIPNDPIDRLIETVCVCHCFLVLNGVSFKLNLCLNWICISVRHTHKHTHTLKFWAPKIDELFCAEFATIVAADGGVVAIDFSQWESSIGVRSKSQKEMIGNRVRICITQSLPAVTQPASSCKETNQSQHLKKAQSYWHRTAPTDEKWQQQPQQRH